MRTQSIFAAVLVMLLACHEPALAQFGGGGGSPPKVPAVLSDIPYIKCGTCQAFVKQAMAMVKKLRSEEKPGKKVTEADIIENLEKMCNPDVEAGEWVSKIDLQEEGTELKLVDMGQVGECKAECRTIARACEKVSEDMDLSDLSELLYKNAGRSALEQLACRDQTGVCNKKPPPLPKDRAPGAAFEPMDEDKLERERIMRNMRAQGLKGQMYDRESMMSSMADLTKKMGEDDDDDDDDSGPSTGGSLGKGIPDMVLPSDLSPHDLPKTEKIEL